MSESYRVELGIVSNTSKSAPAFYSVCTAKYMCASAASTTKDYIYWFYQEYKAHVTM